MQPLLLNEVMKMNKVPSVPSIRGLQLVCDFVSVDQEEQLLRKIDTDYATEWRSDLLRRVQHYGFRYDYKARRVDESMKLGPLPSFLSELAEGLVTKDWFQRQPDQAIINEYLPGQGISLHIDCVPCFGPVIASLSLGSDCVMEFRHKINKDTQFLMLPRRSLVILRMDARYLWAHSIPARRTDAIEGLRIERSRRISITFRTVDTLSEKTAKRSGSRMRTQPQSANSETDIRPADIDVAGDRGTIERLDGQHDRCNTQSLRSDRGLPMKQLEFKPLPQVVIDGARQNDMFSSRAKIPGGWLVRMHENGVHALTFVPDPEHKWDGASLPDKSGAA